MFFISKLLLIISLSETFAHITQNIETTLLPAWNPTSAEEIALTLKVFGKQIQLNLRRNDQIVSSAFKIWKHDAKGKTEEQLQLNTSDSCYYHHKDHISSAVINFCQEYGLEGVVFLKDVTLEITPLQDDSMSSSLIGDSCVEKDINVSFGKPYLIKRSFQLFTDSNFYRLDNFKRNRRRAQNTQETLYLELAVFLDEPAYRTFMPFLNRDKKEVRDLVITYVNGIQALFYHPSLGVPIRISVSYLEIFEIQPADLPHFGGDEKKLLDSFCKYADILNPSSDDNAHHWDIGLYITGLDLHNSETNNYISSGISNLNGSCNSNLSCAVVEFGGFTFGQIKFPTTRGFGSIYTAAREIGHILGMNYDSVNNTCTNSFIMAPIIHGHRDRTSWSDCSRQVAENLWQIKHCLRDQPNVITTNEYKITGLRSNSSILREWTAKRQCELFLRDKNANAVTLHDACISLQCETPLKSGYYFAGPALPGTHCAPERECRHGECKRLSDNHNKSSRNEESSWTEWNMDPCKSICLEKSKGVIVQRRYCRNRNNGTGNCEGPSYDVVLCDDSILCSEKRKTINEFITEKCAFFGNIITKPKFNAIPSALQGLYNDKKPWLACTIHCQPKDSTKFQSIREEMLDINIDPYLLDGTWCHVENGQNYYCRKHYCVPENYQFGQNW